MRIPLEGCEIRSYRSLDLGALVKYANNRNVAINLRDRFPSPYGRVEGQEWLNNMLNQSTETNFAIASSGELIGGIGLAVQDDVWRHSAEIGFWLGEPYWNRGYATQAVKALTSIGFNQLGLIRIYAYVFEWNKPSARVLEKAGYVLEGRLKKAILKENRMTDQLIYAILKPGM